MYAIYLIGFIWFALYGIHLALKHMPFVNKLMGYIWVDPTTRHRAAVAKRVKELCVDGNVPDETTILMAANEMNMSEDALKEVLDGLSPALIKAMAKGDGLSSLLMSAYKASRKVKGG